MSARSHRFEDVVIPSSLFYCDSSFILNIITDLRNRNERFKEDCSNFLRKLQRATADDVMLMTSDFAIDEIVYKIVENDLQGLLPCPFPTRNGTITLQRPAELLKHRPDCIRGSFDKIDAFCQFLEDVPIVVIEPGDLVRFEGAIHSEAIRLMKAYLLSTTDAFHIATGKAAGADCFVAVDVDWLRVDEIDLYTCLST